MTFLGRVLVLVVAWVTVGCSGGDGSALFGAMDVAKPQSGAVETDSGAGGAAPVEPGEDAGPPPRGGSTGAGGGSLAGSGGATGGSRSGSGGAGSLTGAGGTGGASAGGTTGAGGGTEICGPGLHCPGNRCGGISTCPSTGSVECSGGPFACSQGQFIDCSQVAHCVTGSRCMGPNYDAYCSSVCGREEYVNGDTYDSPCVSFYAGLGCDQPNGTITVCVNSGVPLLPCRQCQKPPTSPFCHEQSGLPGTWQCTNP